LVSGKAKKCWVVHYDDYKKDTFFGHVCMMATRSDQIDPGLLQKSNNVFFYTFNYLSIWLSTPFGDGFAPYSSGARALRLPPQTPTCCTVGSTPTLRVGISL